MNVEVQGNVVVHQINNKSTIKKYLKLFRVTQWTKNGLVLAPLIFSGELLKLDSVFQSIIGLLIFCLISSSVYLLNDSLDAEKDRLHPVKKFRPIASGIISKKLALTIMAFIWLLFLPISYIISPLFLGALLVYLFIQINYCFNWKNIVIVDVLCIASGFVLRAIAGALILDVIISPWLIVCTVLLSLFLALAKRRHELMLLNENAGNHRKILKDYSIELLDQLLSIVTGTTIMAYSLYTFTSGKSHLFMITIIFVVYGIFRYLYLIHQKGLGGSPEKVLIQDKPLIINILLWCATSAIILYV
jgi:4-hydroxybenzoate polyprenyltransferase